jgi:hypothetical protein
MSLTHSSRLESLELLGEDELWRTTDIFGNSPLFFVARRPAGIFEGVKRIVQHWVAFRGPSLAAQNHNLQNFLFALNPFGLGPHLHELGDLLVFLRNNDANIDLSHRDIHGQTFLHCLLHHVDFESTPESVQRLKQIIHYYSIKDCRDNQGRTFSDVLKLQMRDPVSWTIWSSAALRLRNDEVGKFMLGHLTHPTRMDEHGNTVLHWLVRNEHQFCVKQRSLFYAILLEVLNRTPSAMDYLDRSGESPLFLAVKLGKPRIVRWLLQMPSARYDVDNYMAVPLLSAARAELRLAEQEGTHESLLRYADILLCMTFVLDINAGVPLPSPTHIFRGEQELDTASRI